MADSIFCAFVCGGFLVYCVQYFIDELNEYRRINREIELNKRRREYTRRANL